MRRNSIDHLHQALDQRTLLSQRVDDDVHRQLQLPRRVPAAYIVSPAPAAFAGRNASQAPLDEVTAHKIP